MKNYYENIDYLSYNFSEVSGLEFYSFIFPNNENQGDLKSDYSQPNAIYLYQDKKDIGTDRTLRRRIMLNDTWESDYNTFIKDNPNTLCSGLSYRGRSNKLNNAQQMNALVFDLDSVAIDNLKNLVFRFQILSLDIYRSLPTPTFLVVSGTGVHLYYVFDEPIDLYPNIKIQMKALKHYMTERIWDYGATTEEETVQFQSINQGFRMVGSVNDKYDVPIRAFRTGDTISIEKMNVYVDEEDSKVDLNRPFNPSKLTREEAKENYPEWYERVVVNGDKRPKKWNIKERSGDALYRWWLTQKGKVKGGHRYFFMMCMSVYASKCEVPLARLEEDMYEIKTWLNHKVPHKSLLTDYDVQCALECYSKDYYNFTRADIERLSAIRIDPCRRNYRTQADHLRRARLVQVADYPNGEWRSKNSKEEMVKNYIKENPNAKITEIAASLNISRKTVAKYCTNDKEEMVKNYIKENPNATVTEIAKALNISRPTVYKYKK